MSLNDPHWGRNGSEEEPPKDENKKGDIPQEKDYEEDDFQEPPLRQSPTQQTQQPQMPNQNDGSNGDLEELWKQFNDRLNSILGNRAGKKDPGQNQNANQGNEIWDSSEPPPRENHPFNYGFGGNGGSGGNRRRRPPIRGADPGSSKALFIIALLAALIVWVATGFYIVPEGEKGVVTTFGRFTETSNPGFRWHIPYPIQDVDLVDVSSVRKAEIGMRGSPQRLKEALMLTDDENIVDVMFNVQYRIQDGHGAEEFLFRTRDPMGAVVQTAESAMREVVGRKKMDSVLFESKQEIAEEVKKLMQEMLDRYHSGIQILSVAIQNAQPPEQVQAAFNDAVKAGQDRERQINEGEAYANDVVPKARGMAERLRQEAEAYKSRVISQAQGDASRFNQVLEQYKQAPKVTRDRMYVDTMQQIFNNTSKVMVDTKNSNPLLYMPLEKLLDKSNQAIPTNGQTVAEPLASPSVQTSAAAAVVNDGSNQVNNSTSRSLSRDFR